MPFIENYGFTKTVVQNNQDKTENEVEWISDYDGNIANLNLNINDNGDKEFVSMQLTNNDLKHLFGVQPISMSLDKRLSRDFLTLASSSKRRHTKRKRKSKRRKTSRR
jgi:hypothetical protein